MIRACSEWEKARKHLNDEENALHQPCPLLAESGRLIQPTNTENLRNSSGTCRKKCSSDNKFLVYFFVQNSARSPNFQAKCEFSEVYWSFPYW